MTKRPPPLPEPTDEQGSPREIKTLNEVCLLLGISPGRISQLRTEGVLSPDAHGQYDIFKVIPAYCAALRSRKKQRAEAGTVNDSEKRLAKARADMAEQKRDLQAGLIMPVAAVDKLWGATMSRLRQHLLVLPTKIAPLVAVERETEPCRLIVEEQVHEALRELSNAVTAEAIADQAVGEESTDHGLEPAEAAAEADSEPMGGPEPETEFGGEFGTGPLDDVEG